MKWYEDKEYREMCEGAEKLQEQKKQIEFGNYYIYFDDKATKQEVKVWSQKNPIDRETRVCLFSQEDLQEMVNYHKCPACHSVRISRYQNGMMDSWVNNEMENVHYKKLVGWGGPNTMNQLWLAFVMHELYHKKWNPEKKKWEEEK